MIHDHKFASHGNGSVSAGTGRTVWQVIEEACDLKVTGEVSLTTSSPSRTKVYLMNGLVYFAETETDESLATRLVLVGALDQQQLKNGMLKINGVENLGRLFDRDSSIDRDAVEIAIESITEQTLAEAADLAVESFRTTMYRHHPSGIHRWYSSQLSSDAETGAMAPMVTIVPVVVTEPAENVATSETTETIEPAETIETAEAFETARTPEAVEALSPALAAPPAVQPVELVAFDSPEVVPPVPTPAPTTGLVPLNGLVSMTPTTPEEPHPVRNPDAPAMRPSPPIVELATLLAHPSVPVPEPILLEQGADVFGDDTSTMPMTDWDSAARTTTRDAAPPSPPPAELVELPRCDPPALVPLTPPIATPIVPAAADTAAADIAALAARVAEQPTSESVPAQRADVWADLWAAAPEEVPVDAYGVVEPAPAVPTAQASSPWGPPTLTASPAPAPAEPVSAAGDGAPTPILPTFATPPVMKISQQSAAPRAVLANAAPTFELDADGPRLPEHGATEAGPATIQPEPTFPVVAGAAPTTVPNALDSWAGSSGWAQELAAEITGTRSTGLTSISPINGNHDNGSSTFAAADGTTTAVQMGLQPIAPMAPIPSFAASTPSAPAVPPAPTIVPMARVEPTPAPEHLIPPLGSTPVPEDVAAAVRRAIAAIEAATLSTGPSAVSFGPMHVAAPTPLAPPPMQFGVAPSLAPALTVAGNNALPKLEATPTSPHGIAVQDPDGKVTPLLSLSTPMSGTAFAPALSSFVSNGSGPHLPDLPASPVGPPLGIERRSALRRLVDNIRGH